jgi:cyclic lactone autoinducer peptide
MPQIQRLSRKGVEYTMKKTLHKLLAAITKKAAISGAGLASNLGYYQPKVPERLAK